MTHPCDEEDLFAAALALPASERNGYLQRACAGAPGLLERLKDLLDVFADATNFINERSNTAQDPSDQIGPYRLLQELGEGGCGVAYLAEQTAPVKRHVALKVIKPGMDTKAVIARFEAEQQLLALMDHPNVARVFDAGTTAAGRPYFVMELVRGIKITDYCDHSRLTVCERLTLFAQVCQAIQHAHQKGIIHRDIKPSNVLVTMHDGLPVAKVIDFGLAKAMQGLLIDQTLYTAIDQFVGTPAYVSPEQTEPGLRGIDTRSDIYSLGVLLYELLTGRTPIDTAELLQAGIEEMRQRIRNEEPARPSRRLSTSVDETIQNVSACCGTTAAKLIKEIQGDLDWIVMRCLEKEPARRYQTVNDLIGDLQRYLRHDIVLARPPNLSYVVRKFARRNRLVFASGLVGAVFVICIIGFAIVTSIQAQRIATERDRAERESDQAKRVANVVLNVLATTDPFQKLTHETTERELLDRLARSVTTELGGQPEARARLLEAVGLAYRRRGEIKEAIGLLEDAVQTREEIQNGDDLATVNAMTELSMALRIGGKSGSARAMLAKADRLATRRGLTRSIPYVKLLLERGRSELSASRIPEARKALEEGLTLSRDLRGTPGTGTDLAMVLLTLSNVFRWTDDLEQSENIAREAVAILEPIVPAMHPDRVRAEVELAEVLYLQGRTADAERLFLDALEKQSRLFGRNSRQVADALESLAQVRRSQRRLADAETLARRAIAVSNVALGEKHMTTASYAASLAKILIESAKYSEAESELRRALDIYAMTLSPDHQYIASAEYFLGEVFLATGRLGEAETILTASMNRWKRSGAPSWRAARSANALGEALHRQGRIEDAEKYLTESFRELSIDPKADLAAKDKARERVARYLKASPVQKTDEPIQLASKRRT